MKRTLFFTALLTCPGTATALRLADGWTVPVIPAEEIRAAAGPTLGLVVRAGQGRGDVEEMLQDIAHVHETLVGPLPDSLEVRELTASSGRRIRVRYADPRKPDREYRLTYRLGAGFQRMKP